MSTPAAAPQPFHDLFSGQSQAYAEYRPEYPPEVFAHLSGLAPKARRVLDAATGSGQAAAGLAQRFARILACDASTSQLAHARRHPGVTYFQARAEALPLPQASIDLLTAAQAAHWFDFPRFYAEVRRVVRPNGVLAVWCYHLPRVSPAVDRIVDRLADDITGPYWNERRRFVDDHYRSLPFPFAELPAPEDLWIRSEWRLGDLAGYLSSWSAVQAYHRAHGRSPLDEVAADLLQAWGDPLRSRPVLAPLGFRIGRVG